MLILFIFSLIYCGCSCSKLIFVAQMQATPLKLVKQIFYYVLKF